MPGYNLGMEDFKNSVVQAIVSAVIGLFMYILFGVVFVGWILIWNFFEMFF